MSGELESSWLSDEYERHPGGDQTDDRPLPEIIIDNLGGTMAYVDTVDNRRLYCVRDWVYCVSGSKNQSRAVPWSDLKRAMFKRGDAKVYENFVHLTIDTPGGPQTTEFADAQGLYQITQRMTDRSATVRRVKTYLAAAGVFTDDVRRDPHTVIASLETYADNKDFQDMMAEGFTPEEAEQWLTRRGRGKESRKRQVEEWARRGIQRRRDFARLTNDVSTVALGDTATRQKRALQLRKSDTPRNYVSAAELALLEVTETLSTGLHVVRDSQGLDELSEDIHDTAPMINRDAVYAGFSKKRRRLPSGE